MLSAKMLRPLVDYSDHDEEEEEEVNKSNIFKEEKSEAGEGMEKFITVNIIEKFTNSVLSN